MPKADTSNTMKTLPIKRPSARLLLLEARAGLETAQLALTHRALVRQLPRGDGHAVMVLPGFGATDTPTLPLRRILQALGYQVYGWDQGRNLGMRSALRAALSARLQNLSDRHGAVTLIGWSLGGVFAREMARHAPGQVRRVITLGSPISGDPDANNLMPLFSLINRGKVSKTDPQSFARRIPAPPVPCTALYSKTDGIVAWHCCLEAGPGNVENIQVHGSHMGLIVNRQAITVIAQRLAQPVPV